MNEDLTNLEGGAVDIDGLPLFSIMLLPFIFRQNYWCFY